MEKKTSLHLPFKRSIFIIFPNSPYFTLLFFYLRTLVPPQYMGNSTSCCDRVDCCTNLHDTRITDKQKGFHGSMRKKPPPGFSLICSVPDEFVNDQTEVRNRAKSAMSRASVHPLAHSLRGQSSWIKVPDPLPDWTSEEQQAIVDIMNEFPKACSDSTQFERALQKAMKQFPHKNEQKFIQCFRHIQKSRVAYFGSFGGERKTNGQKLSRQSSM